MDLKPGTLIMDLEGHDVGPEGAVVTRVRNNTVELVRRHDGADLKVKIDDLEFVEQDPELEPDVSSGWYDDTALDSPELDTIRALPTYWGPRDPNMPSTLTDVTWRPQNRWRRWQQRHYSTEEKSMRKRALTIDPLPIKQPGNPNNQYRRQFFTPDRVQLQRWSRDSEILSVDELLVLTADFWKGYWQKRNTYLPAYGNRKNLQLKDWALMFQQHYNLTNEEMFLLYDFMVETSVVPEHEAQYFADMLDALVVHVVDRI